MDKEKFITIDDYKKLTGIDLKAELPDQDDASNKITRFVVEAIDWCLETLKIEYRMNDTLETMPTYELNQFKRGVMKQMEYWLRNGKLNIDSGFDQTLLTKIDLSDKFIAPDALKAFRAGGMCNII